MDQNSSSQSVSDSSIPVSVSIETPSTSEPILTSTPIPGPVVTDAVTVPVPNSVSKATFNTITSEYRDKVYKELAQAMLDGLENGNITVEQSDEISHFVLDHLDKVNTKVDMAVFLQELVNKWPVYQFVLLRFQDESQKDEEIKEVQENINQITNQ